MGRLTGLVRRSYSVLLDEGVDAWIEQIPAEEVVVNRVRQGGREEARAAARTMIR